MTSGPARPGIGYRVEEPAAVITLNNPRALNALTFDMLGELRSRVREAVDDPRVVGVVLTGAGHGFCAGLDAAAVAATTSGAPVPPSAQGAGRYAGTFSYLLEQPKPVIAAVNGVAAGAGFVLATLCDLRFASTDACFVSAFSRRGLTAEMGVSWTLPRLVGTGHALDILWSSRRIAAAEAFTIGLVEHVVAAEGLLDAARGYLGELAEQASPRAIADIKRQVYEEAGMEIGPALTHAWEATGRAIGRPDAGERAAAFLEGRAPRFARIGVVSDPGGEPRQTRGRE